MKTLLNLILTILFTFTLFGNLHSQSAEIVSVSLNAVSPSEFSGTCPHVFQFNGEIKVEGKISKKTPVTIKYTFLRSDGAIAPTNTLTYYSSGSQSISTTWTLGAEGEHWEKVKAWISTEKFSEKAVIRLKCVSKIPQTNNTGNNGLKGGEIDRSCVDLSIEKITATRSTEPTRIGKIDITMYVKNLSSITYSNPIDIKDIVQLKWWVGVTPDFARAELPLTINAGQEIIAITYHSMWDNIPGNGVEGTIIYSGSNFRTNFDCNSNNNRKFITPDSVR